MERYITKQVRVGDVIIGGGAPISIQSMTNTDTRDVSKTIEQIAALKDAGCQIVRCAVPDMEAARAIGVIKSRVKIPVVADIHFDYRLAVEAVQKGADKVRINPGNIGNEEGVRAVIKICKERDIPIRVGVNSGSLEKNILKEFGGVTAKALVESVKKSVAIVKGMDFHNLVISLKASDVKLNYDAHMLVKESLDEPVHIGVTEAGTINTGKTKSAVGIGALLMAGIGDTLRVSLTGDPCEEIVFAKEILKVTGHRKRGIDLISCPTCGRTEVDLIGLTSVVEARLGDYQNKWEEENLSPIKIAIMGCEVNGPGEAAEADIGIAFGRDRAVIFVEGEIVKAVPADLGLNTLFKYLEERYGIYR